MNRSMKELAPHFAGFAALAAIVSLLIFRPWADDGVQTSLTNSPSPSPSVSSAASPTASPLPSATPSATTSATASTATQDDGEAAESSTNSPTAASSSSTPTASPQVTASPEDIAAGTESIESFVEDPELHLSSQAAEYFQVNPEDLLPEGTVIKTLEQTWTQVDADTAMVQIEVTEPGLDTASYTAVMVREDGEWKLMATIDAAELEQDETSSN